jgi:hypothetical protein
MYLAFWVILFNIKLSVRVLPMECRSFASRIKASLNGEPVKYIEYIGLATCSYELPTSKEFEVVFCFNNGAQNE